MPVTAPAWRVLRGNPDHDQLAALAVVFAAVAAARRPAAEGSAGGAPPVRARWRRENAYRTDAPWRTAPADGG